MSSTQMSCGTCEECLGRKTEGHRHDNGNLWMLDTALCGLSLMCKVGDFEEGRLSTKPFVTGDVLNHEKYFVLILQGSGRRNSVVVTL